MQAMESAPRDGSDIVVLGPRGWRRCHYVDCQWLRDDGEPTIADCWRPDTIWEGDIELDEARGWKPAASR